MSFESHSRVFVAGHRGLVGSAVCRALEARGFKNVITRSRQELDLRDEQRVREFFKNERPEFVVLAAARVGGIGANSREPVQFLEENLRIQLNVISSAAESHVEKLVFLGSSCIYPKEARYPLTEDQLLTGPFEPTNEAYALAKVVGLKHCQYYAQQYGKKFISLMPTNLYGPNDYYDEERSHVIPAMLVKVLKAQRENLKSVTFWGSGKPMREFLHSDDLAEAVLFSIENYESETLLNVGSGEEISIKDLALLIKDVSGFEGEIVWDQSKPDGMLRKPIDSSAIRSLGWTPRRSLRKGLEEAWRELSANN